MRFYQPYLAIYCKIERILVVCLLINMQKFRIFLQITMNILYLNVARRIKKDLIHR